MVSAEPTRRVVVPTPDDAFDCARAAVCRVMEVPPDSVTAATRLAGDLGADSLAVIETAELMEDEIARRFRLRVAVDDLALVRTATVGGLADELWRALTSARRPARTARGQ